MRSTQFLFYPVHFVIACYRSYCEPCICKKTIWPRNVRSASVSCALYDFYVEVSLCLVSVFFSVSCFMWPGYSVVVFSILISLLQVCQFTLLSSFTPLFISPCIIWFSVGRCFMSCRFSVVSRVFFVFPQSDFVPELCYDCLFSFKSPCIWISHFCLPSLIPQFRDT